MYIEESEYALWQSSVVASFTFTLKRRRVFGVCVWKWFILSTHN